MNEAQFLLSLGLVPKPRQEGLATPAIENCTRGIHEVWDHELGGTIFLPKPRTPKGTKP